MFQICEFATIVNNFLNDGQPFFWCLGYRFFVIELTDKPAGIEGSEPFYRVTDDNIGWLRAVFFWSDTDVDGFILAGWLGNRDGLWKFWWLNFGSVWGDLLSWNKFADGATSIPLDETGNHASSFIVMYCVKCFLRVSGWFSGGLLPFLPAIRQKRYHPFWLCVQLGNYDKCSESMPAMSEEQTNSLKHAELFKSKSFFGWTPRAEQLLLFGKRWVVVQEMLNRVD